MPNLDSIKRRLAPFGRGLMMEMIPGIAAGTINEFFHQWDVTVVKITQDVQDNRSLWNGMEPEKKRELGAIAQRVGNLDFITPEFLINSIRKDFPGVASLFLNSPSAGKWLERQIEELKVGVTSIEP
jgi:hypothetical protein